MPIELNESAFKHAQRLIEHGDYVADDKDKWSEDQPSTDDQNMFLDEHGFEDYGNWFLGINTDKPEDTKGRYEFPYGDFEKVHRCGVLSAESRVRAVQAHRHRECRRSSTRHDRLQSREAEVALAAAGAQYQIINNQYQ